MKQTYTGGCHCGRVRFQVDADLAREQISDCNCSICTKKGFLHLIVEKERFRALHEPDAISTYRFNTGVAQHHFCRSCGIHSYYVPRSHPNGIDVNVRCLDGVDLSTLQITRFDGQRWEENVHSLSSS